MTTRFHFGPNLSLNILPTWDSIVWRANCMTGSSFFKVGMFPKIGWSFGWGGLLDADHLSLLRKNKYAKNTLTKRTAVIILTLRTYEWKWHHILTLCYHVMKEAETSSNIESFTKLRRMTVWFSVVIMKSRNLLKIRCYAGDRLFAPNCTVELLKLNFRSLFPIHS